MLGKLSFEHCVLSISDFQFEDNIHTTTQPSQQQARAKEQLCEKDGAKSAVAQKPSRHVCLWMV